MFLHEGLIAHFATAFKVVVQVVEFDGNGDSVAGPGDAADIVEVGFAFIVSEETKGVYNLSAHSHLKEVAEGIRGILNYVVEKSGALFFRSFPRQSDGEGMEYYGVAVNVVLTAMSLQGYLKAKVNHFVSGFGCLLFGFHFLEF